MKKVSLFLSIAIAFVLSITAGQTVQAKSTNEDSKIESTLDNKTSIANIQDSLSINARKININNYKIIDIESFALELGISLEDNGKQLKRIEVKYMPNDFDEVVSFSPSTELVQPLGLLYFIDGKKDHGSGWYNASTDLYHEIVVPGPDVAKLSKTDTFTATRTGNFGISDKTVSSSVGFTIGQSYSVTFSSETPVAAGTTLHLKAYTTYSKMELFVYDQLLANYQGSIFAYRPTGSYITKAWY